MGSSSSLFDFLGELIGDDVSAAAREVPVSSISIPTAPSSSGLAVGDVPRDFLDSSEDRLPPIPGILMPTSQAWQWSHQELASSFPSFTLQSNPSVCIPPSEQTRSSGTAEPIRTQPKPVRGRGETGPDDGYNWRKYGQKQVKGSEKPRSYYKCTRPDCPTKKIVKRSVDGQFTEIVYKGTHNHEKPPNTRRCNPSLNSIATTTQPGFVPMVSCSQAESSAIGTTVKPEDDEYGEELDAKQRKRDGENNEDDAGPISLTVRETRVVIQTTSEVDVLDDGYRWRKYGQKVVKGNPNPRSYFKCNTPGCLVRKHVERSANDPMSVITTYEGKHHHDVPTGRRGGDTLNPTSSAAGSSLVVGPTAAALVPSTGRQSSFPMMETTRPVSVDPEFAGSERVFVTKPREEDRTEVKYTQPSRPYPY